MNYTAFFAGRRFLPERALRAGFAPKDGGFLFRTDLENRGFYAVVTVSGGETDVKVFEYPDGEEYIPFGVKTAGGAFVAEIRREVESILSSLRDECFELSDGREILMSFCRERFGTVPETPWEEYPDFYTFKTEKSKKWYALFMRVPYRSLHVDRDGFADVVNIKLPPEKITSLVDGDVYLPAYHMNKKYWMTVLLDGKADIGKVKELIEESYSLAEK